MNRKTLNNSVIEFETLNGKDNCNSTEIQGTGIIRFSDKIKTFVVAQIEGILKVRMKGEMGWGNYQEMEQISFRVNEILSGKGYEYLLIGNDLKIGDYERGRRISYSHFLYTKIQTGLSHGEEEQLHKILSKGAHINREDKHFLEEMEEKRKVYQKEVEHQFHIRKNKHQGTAESVELF